MRDADSVALELVDGVLDGLTVFDINDDDVLELLEADGDEEATGEYELVTLEEADGVRDALALRAAIES